MNKEIIYLCKYTEKNAIFLLFSQMDGSNAGVCPESSLSAQLYYSKTLEYLTNILKLSQIKTRICQDSSHINELSHYLVGLDGILGFYRELHWRMCNIKGGFEIKTISGHGFQQRCLPKKSIFIFKKIT